MIINCACIEDNNYVKNNVKNNVIVLYIIIVKDYYCEESGSHID